MVFFNLLLFLIIQFGVDVNATARVLLQSSNPPLYANVNCNALVAAIVNRQVSMVQLLLQVNMYVHFYLAVKKDGI